MNKPISIRINGAVKTIDRGTSLETLAAISVAHRKIVAARVNNVIRELTYCPVDDCNVEWIDLNSTDGERIYLRSLTFLFIRACHEIFPKCKVSIEHSYGRGLYCEVHGEPALTPRQVNRIETRMREIVALNEPFEKIEVASAQAADIFNEMGFYDKTEILKYRSEDTMNIYKCGWMKDYLYGYMVPSTGYLDIFKLKFYLPGVIIQYPKSQYGGVIPEFEDSPKLFKVFRQSEKWCRRINVSNVAQLNHYIERGAADELINICEAHQEKQIIRIADEIGFQRDRIRLILIAGPSSSGKTTFSQRLKVQLMVNGLKPVQISMDDYFFNRSDVPVDENGKQDLESIDIIDLELFNEHMSRLIQGQEVMIPHFNFEKGIREYRGNTVAINEDQPIIVEGIHCLNEKLTCMIPKENKYKIYISALTQLNIDDHNRIPTTDTRLIRRMIRDYKFRGTSVSDTLAMWMSVRRGEEKYIFPYQEQADVMINSALIYELAVLKPIILPLLNEFPDDNPFYSEVVRLQKFLKYFLDLDSTSIPNNSILREFIGGSCFK